MEGHTGYREMASDAGVHHVMRESCHVVGGGRKLCCVLDYDFQVVSTSGRVESNHTQPHQRRPRVVFFGDFVFCVSCDCSRFLGAPRRVNTRTQTPSFGDGTHGSCLTAQTPAQSNALLLLPWSSARAVYHGRLSRSEFHEGQVPLKARGSCSWCWYSSRHIQRVVNICRIEHPRQQSPDRIERPESRRYRCKSHARTHNAPRNAHASCRCNEAPGPSARWSHIYSIQACSHLD